MPPKLLPCPLCGGTGKRLAHNHGGEWVRCTRCFHEGPMQGSVADAAAAWNRRRTQKANLQPKKKP